MLRLACIACLLSALLQAVPVAADLFTEEPLSIKTLLADPKPYELHSVTLHGVVRELRLLDPPIVTGRGDGRCRNAYIFRLDDGTASVAVGVPVKCLLRSLVIKLDVVEGETVFIEGQVLAPGTYIGEALSPLTKIREDVLVMATRIWRSGSLDQSKTQEQTNPQGRIDFETFRLIARGMTREEVVRLAGLPAEQYECVTSGPCFDRWLYYYGDNWEVEVLFAKSGHVLIVRNTRKE